MTQYVNPNPPPPPQLSKDDLARLTPDQIVAADAAGQFQVLKTEGRNPTETERLGQRWATPRRPRPPVPPRRRPTATCKTSTGATSVPPYRRRISDE